MFQIRDDGQIPLQFRFELLGIILANIILSFIWEVYVVGFYARYFSTRREKSFLIECDRKDSLLRKENVVVSVDNLS